MEMPGRKYNPQGYRYGFNGKENDRSGEWGLGLVQDYGFRLYNPGLGRFLSVDPLTEKYPELTTYQFASNTPIQAIDLDGLEAFFVYGTLSDPSRWLTNGNLSTGSQYLFKASSNKTWNNSFIWGGTDLLVFRFGNGAYNDVEDRTKAAERLANHVFSNRNQNNSEDITLIAHSHGGNVAIQAIPIIRKMLDDAGFKDTKINLITVSTPAVNKKNDIENPEKLFQNRSLGVHMHIYNAYDGIQVSAANLVDTGNDTYYSETYDNGYTYNYLVDLSKYYKKIGSSAAHSADQLHPETLKMPVDVELIKIPEASKRTPTTAKPNKTTNAKPRPKS
jgi:RHS repeat-associated protein